MTANIFAFWSPDNIAGLSIDFNPLSLVLASLFDSW